MVIKGRSRSNGSQLADYLLNSRSNDNAQILDIRGTAQPGNLKKSLLEMSLTSELTRRGNKGLYHAQVNPAIGEDRPMTYDDWVKAADILERHLGFTDQKRVIVLHEKAGRLHGHVVWERYDHDKGKLRTDSQNFKKHDNARAEIEQALNHERTPQRRAKEPTHTERLTELWRQHPDGREFVAAAQTVGYHVAHGNDRRPFHVVTPDGQSLDLVRQLDGIGTKTVRDRLQPIRDDLPTQADALQRVKPERIPVMDGGQPVAVQSENLRELSESQDLFNAMIKHHKQKGEPAKTAGVTYSYSFKFEQSPPLLRVQKPEKQSDNSAKSPTVRI